jgi:hypothetical protein
MGIQLWSHVVGVSMALFNLRHAQLFISPPWVRGVGRCETRINPGSSPLAPLEKGGTRDESCTSRKYAS